MKNVSFDLSFLDKNYEDRVKNICVDFSTLIDTDYGSIWYMIHNYPISKYFIEYAKDWTEYYAKCMILSRQLINPLSVILKKEYQDQADNLYQELIDLQWEEVFSGSPSTDVSTLIYNTFEYSGFTVTVNCRNTQEEECIKTLVPRWNTIIGFDDISKYFCFFIHDLSTRAEELKDTFGNCIYIYDHNPNFVNFKKKLLKEDILKIERNEIKIISPYKDIEFPYDMTPNDMEVSTNAREYQTE